MRESEFIVLAGKTLANIEHAFDSDGFDCFAAGDGVLEIESGSGEKIVVNRHAASQEMWVAARSGGFHFRWDGSAWRNTKDGHELMDVLRGLAK